MNQNKKVITGVGLAALAAAAAGAIYLYGTESGKKRRKEIKSWTLRMKADLLDDVAKMKDWSEDAYKKAVDTVASRYAKLKEIEPAEVAALAASLKAHWRAIRREVESSLTPPARTRPKRRVRSKSKTTTTTTTGEAK